MTPEDIEIRDQHQKNKENSLLVLCKFLDAKSYVHLIDYAEKVSFWKVAGTLSEQTE